MSDYEVRALPLYTNEHTWVKKSGGNVVVGITDYAQKALKEISYVDLPAEGDKVTQMEPCASLESNKAVSDFFCPVSGTVTAVNEAVLDDPSVINANPYDAGWLLEIEPDDFDGEKGNLMTAKEYEALLETL